MTLVPGSNTVSITAVGVDQVGFLVETFSSSLKAIQVGHTKLFNNAMEAYSKSQDFIDLTCQKLLDRVEAETDVEKMHEYTKIYEKIMKLNIDAKLGTAERSTKEGLDNLKVALDNNHMLIKNALDTRKGLIEQEEKKLEIIIKDKEAAQKLQEQNKKFDADLAIAKKKADAELANANEKAKADIRIAHDKAKADIDQRQFDAYLEAYKRDCATADAILAKHRNVTIVKSPPTLNPLQPGYVRCTGIG